MAILGLSVGVGGFGVSVGVGTPAGGLAGPSAPATMRQLPKPKKSEKVLHTFGVQVAQFPALSPNECVNLIFDFEGTQLSDVIAFGLPADVGEELLCQAFVPEVDKLDFKCCNIGHSRTSKRLLDRAINFELIHP